MILNAFRIANFKAFRSVQRVPVRPITLIYGANSAGKSSVLHALALAYHAIETGDLDTQRTRIGGEAIDLGGLRQYVHRRERHRQVELTFELDPRRLSGRARELLRSARDTVMEIGFGGASSENDVRMERFAVEVDGAPLLSMSARSGGLLRLDRLDHSHPVFRELLRGQLMLATTTESIHEEDFSALGELLDTLIPGITAKTRGFVPRIDEEFDGSEAEGRPWDAFVPVSRGHREEDLARATRLFLPRALRDLVGGLSADLESEIRKLRYLGPLRSSPPRHLAFSQHQDPNWFAGGGYAWDVVRTREDVRRRVNIWLGDPDRLKTPYRIELRDLLPASTMATELPAKLETAMHDIVAQLLKKLASEENPDIEILAHEVAQGVLGGQDGIVPEITELVASATDVEAQTEHWVKDMIEARSEALQDLVLIDKRTDSPVSHRDVGIGISQVLPVLVSAYASSNELIAIEQPEIHLHPALQAELGDVFLQSALAGGGNTFLVETHSEHLLLRIMRRMRETNASDLPDAVPEVRPDDVMVLFVESDGPQSIIREMPLNERGELVKAWPGGFFEEGLREIF